MITFLIISAIIIASLLIWAWVKLVNLFLPTEKTTTIENPYIHSHLIRRANDKAYEDYLNWLDKTGGDLPIEKVKSKEELEFERELKL